MDFQGFFNMVRGNSDVGDTAQGQSAVPTFPEPPAIQPLAEPQQPTSTEGSPTGSVSSALGAMATSAADDGHGADGAPNPYLVDVPAGLSYTFRPSAEETSNFPQLPCTPIALYASESSYSSGRLITVSDTYICYAIKEGHIRAINRHSVIRTLLKGHGKKLPVVDLAFASPSSTILASLGGDGSLIVWRLMERTTSDSKTELTYEILLHVNDIGLQRILWHPHNANAFAVIKSNEMALIDFTKVTGRQPGEGGGPVTMTASTLAELQPEFRLAAHSNQVLDLCFSQDSRYLATGGADGWVRVYEVERRNVVGRWQPYGGAAVHKVLFLHRKSGPSTGDRVFLCTGGKKGSELKLWRAWTTLVPVCAQTIAFEEHDGKGQAFHVEADESGEFLFVADSIRPLLYVANVSLSPSSARVQSISPFTLKHPVLSLLSLAGSGGSSGGSDGTSASAPTTTHDGPSSGDIQLYCVQTQAIQIYHLRLSECRGPAGGSAPTPSLPTPPAPIADAAETPAAPTAVAPAPAPVPVPPPAPAPAPTTTAAEPPAILKMLLRASSKDSAASGGGGAKPADGPSLLTPGAIEGAGEGTKAVDQRPAHTHVSPQRKASQPPPPRPAEDEAEPTQSVSVSVSEEKQTGGAHTNEVGGGGMPATSRGSQSGESSSSGMLTSTRGGEGSMGEEAMGEAPSEQVGEPAAPDAAPAAEATASAPAQVQVHVPVPVVDEAAIARALGPLEDRIARMIARRDRELSEHITSKTRAIVTEALAGLSSDLQHNVSNTVANTVVQRVDKAVKAAVSHQLEGLPVLVNKSLSDAGAALAVAVKEPVGASFKQCFAEQLIPAFTTATQRMFAQINDSLNKGLAANAAGASSGQAVENQVAALRGEIATVATALGSLSAQVELLSQQLSSLGQQGSVTAAQAGGSADGDARRSSQSLKDELRKDVAGGSYDEAFKKALGASDLELVTWLCAEAPKDDIFDAEPPLLSSTVLLCLMQQLSFNLGKDTSLKLEWLKQISLVLQAGDPEIGAFVGGVLEQLHKNLESATSVVRGQADARELRFVHKAVKRMIQDCVR